MENTFENAKARVREVMLITNVCMCDKCQENYTNMMVEYAKNCDKAAVSSLFSLIRQKQKELDEWINSKDEETQHDFIMSTGNAQLLYRGKLEAYNEVVKLISEYN